METYAKVGQAMKGLDAVEMETTFDQSVYFFVLIHPKDLDEFKRRLAEN